MEIAEEEVTALAQAAREAIDARLRLVPDDGLRETFWSLVAKIYARTDEEEGASGLGDQ